MPDEPKWLAWAKELQSIAQIGLTYSKDPHDRMRFERIRELSVEIMEQHTGLDTGKLVDLFASETGYQTPKVDVRAAVFREGAILMVRERADGRWTLPGGWADVGYTVAQVAAKEAWEEAAVRIRPQRVIAILDRTTQNHPPSPYSTYKIFVEASLLAMEEFTSNMETSERAFFAPSKLPELSVERITAREMEVCFAAHQAERFECAFD
ncbi:MAG: NUDIX hydrolase N-terminal domain-containing protein [Spirochaetia bacterium]|jgi:ADP-ribose pyrophosphatase YjhB (NUDIX family)